MDLKEEFERFMRNQKNREDLLIEHLDRAVDLMKKAIPFLETWYLESHSGTGLGAKHLQTQIEQFLKDMK